MVKKKEQNHSLFQLIKLLGINIKNKMNNKLDKLIDFYDLILLDSLKMFMKTQKSKDEYIQMDEISFKEKIRDLDELLKYAEYNELYEECNVLVDMKKQIISNNK